MNIPVFMWTLCGSQKATYNFLTDFAIIQNGRGQKECSSMSWAEDFFVFLYIQMNILVKELHCYRTVLGRINFALDYICRKEEYLGNKHLYTIYSELTEMIF